MKNINIYINLDNNKKHIIKDLHNNIHKILKDININKKTEDYYDIEDILSDIHYNYYFKKLEINLYYKDFQNNYNLIFDDEIYNNVSILYICFYHTKNINIDINKFKNLETLSFTMTYLQKLNLNNLIKLKELEFYDNHNLQELELNNLSNLTKLICNDNNKNLKILKLYNLNNLNIIYYYNHKKYYIVCDEDILNKIKNNIISSNTNNYILKEEYDKLIKEINLFI